MASLVVRSLLSMTVSFGVFSTPLAFAQSTEVDDGEFTSGDEGAAPNQDSDFVQGLHMTTPSFGGTGCRNGSASATLSPDQKTLTVIFDDYIVRAGSVTQVTSARKNCQILIPFQVPAGYRVQVVKLDYRGFAGLPGRSRMVFRSGMRILEVNGRETNVPKVMRRRAILGPQDTEFQMTSVLRGGKFGSPCGKSFTLAAESTPEVQGGLQDDIVGTIDSLDAVAMPLVYSLRWKKCDGPVANKPSRPDRPERPERPERPTRPGRPQRGR